MCQLREDLYPVCTRMVSSDDGTLKRFFYSPLDIYNINLTYIKQETILLVLIGADSALSPTERTPIVMQLYLRSQTGLWEKNYALFFLPMLGLQILLLGLLDSLLRRPRTECQLCKDSDWLPILWCCIYWHVILIPRFQTDMTQITMALYNCISNLTCIITCKQVWPIRVDVTLTITWSVRQPAAVSWYNGDIILASFHPVFKLFTSSAFTILNSATCSPVYPHP